MASRITFSEGLKYVRWPFGREYPSHASFCRDKIKQIGVDRKTGAFYEETVTNYGISIVEVDQRHVDEIVAKVLTIFAVLAIMALLVIGGYYLGRYIHNNKN